MEAKQKAVIQVHPDYTIGQVDPRLFGGFLEHLGRAVYTGVYDPDSPLSDDDGLRTDVMEALKPLALSTVRYPGGNFASGYHWEAGIGPKEGRRANLDLSWKSEESNQFGTDEFIALCRKMDWEPMITVNLGTGTPEEAGHWVEYCNGTKGPYADKRIANGHEEPYNVKLWCLGNEMDASWQLGHLPAGQYALKAEQAARIMKYTDPTIELVIAGSCLPSMPTYMEWDRTVLEYAGHVADYIGFHHYAKKRPAESTRIQHDTTTVPPGSTMDFLASSVLVDRQIEEMDGVCRYVQARTHSGSRVYLCMDEWNVWYRNHVNHGQWAQAPSLLEEEYTFEDALVVASFLLSFIRHADILKIANLAQLVNVLAPVMTNTEGIYLQTIYWAFEMIAPHAADTKAMRTIYTGPVYRMEEDTVPSESMLFDALYPKGSGSLDVQTLDHAVVKTDTGLTIFLLNRSDTQTIEAALAYPAGLTESDAVILTSDDPLKRNSFTEPEAVTPKQFSAYTIDNQAQGSTVTVTIPPMSLVRVGVRC